MPYSAHDGDVIPTSLVGEHASTTTSSSARGFLRGSWRRGPTTARTPLGDPPPRRARPRLRTKRFAGTSWRSSTRISAETRLASRRSTRRIITTSSAGASLTSITSRPARPRRSRTSTTAARLPSPGRSGGCLRRKAARRPWRSWRPRTEARPKRRCLTNRSDSPSSPTFSRRAARPMPSRFTSSTAP